MAAAAIFKENFMETITIQRLWQLLQPSPVFDTRGRYEKCSLLWEAMDEAQQKRIYDSIAAKKRNGDFVNPNPCFALDDAMQDDEYAQAKMKQRKPEFLKGNEGGDLVQVRYNGMYKICTRKTMEEFNLEFVRVW